MQLNGCQLKRFVNFDYYSFHSCISLTNESFFSVHISRYLYFHSFIRIIIIVENVYFVILFFSAFHLDNWPFVLAKMNLSSEKSYILRQSDTLWKALGEEECDQFGKLESDEARVRFVYDLLAEFPQVSSECGRKNCELALDLKKAGNECFKNFKYKDAFRCYSDSLIQMPSDRSKI
jgi:hypothetical protein